METISLLSTFVGATVILYRRYRIITVSGSGMSNQKQFIGFVINEIVRQ
jgi:hypothetical protein